MSKLQRYDDYYMDLAVRTSKMSYAKRKQVGAIIVKDGHIISQGWNGTPAGFNNTCEDLFNKTLPSVIHAEMNAITKLAKSNSSAKKATIYTTLAPCVECSKLIIQSGIETVIYKEDYRTEGLDLLDEAKVLWYII
jgi:dCMP deaminase